MTETWIAEDVPAYLVFKDARRPQTDEDAAMSAAQTVVRVSTRDAAALAMRDHLYKIANMSHKQYDNESPMHRAAGDMFDASRDAVLDPGLTLRIWGRVYRIRKEN